MFTYNYLISLSNKELEEIFQKGLTPNPENLLGWEFRGTNTSDLTPILGIRKFKKGFYKDSSLPQGVFAGYNVKVKQNFLSDEWIDVMKNGKPFRMGWFKFYRVNSAEKDNLYPHAFLINYDWDKNPKLDPSRLLRDYLVQVEKDNPDLYLGKAYINLLGKRVFVSFFVLERYNKAEL